MSEQDQLVMDYDDSGSVCPRDISQPYDIYLSKRIQTWIEQRYYAQIDAHARLEELLFEPSFIKNPHGHSSLFADHGVVHARDVARQILQVLNCINGILIPTRQPARLEFMKGYGVLLAYVHDVGLCDLSGFGRKMHAYTVAQKVLSPEFDELVQALWNGNAGNIPWTLTRLPSLQQNAHLVFREMLALAICHSKSVIPVELLCDPQQLRKALLCGTVIDLHDLFDRMGEPHGMNKAIGGKGRILTPLDADGLGAAISPERLTNLQLYYGDFSKEGFCWLVDQHPQVRRLVEDVIDTLRALRCADALRQRGTTLKTSGNYEIFVDRKTGNAIFALRRRDQELILVEIPDPISAGEANLASCEITKDGDLRASFHRGDFPDAETVQRAATNAALVLLDIERDVIESFKRLTPPEGSHHKCQKNANEMHILLENVGDNPEFASLIQNQLLQSSPGIQNPVQVVPSLKDVSERERELYLEAKKLDWDDKTMRKVLDRIAKSGHKTGPIDPSLAFQNVKQVRIQAGCTLIDAGAQAGFVYIPLNGSLQVIPLGNYPAISIQPWMPLGITAVIRGSVRNATVIAEEDMDLLIIPQEIYLQYWHHTYNPEEFIRWMAGERARQGTEAGNKVQSNPSRFTSKDRSGQA